MSNPFDYLNSINTSKVNMMRGTDNDQLAEKDYNPFLINRGLSYHHDTVAIANEMNMRHDCPNIMQYEFLLNIVRKKKRFAKWNKKEHESELEAVKEYYGYNDTKALQALKILSNDQIEEIKIKINKGGRDA
jgi:hypothetical protein